MNNTCIVNICSSKPYDKDNFGYNTIKIDYQDMKQLGSLLTSTKSNLSYSINMNLMYILNCLKKSNNWSSDVIFRFLCSPDCGIGKQFISEKDPNLTKEVFKFVKIICAYSCVVEFTDHSMSSFFNNWDEKFMEMSKPIEILSWINYGIFKIEGEKNDFVGSKHLILQKIGLLSVESNIKMIFNNLMGICTYKVLTSNVNVISRGQQIPETEHKVHLTSDQLDQKRLYKLFGLEYHDALEQFPIHSEFDYNKGKIVISSIHWSDLNYIESIRELIPENLIKKRKIFKPNLPLKIQKT